MSELEFRGDWVDSPYSTLDCKIICRDGNPVAYLYREDSTGAMHVSADGINKYPVATEAEALTKAAEIAAN